MMLQIFKNRAAADSDILQRSAAFDALEKSQAVIWFELDGTIIEANSNFLEAMGYRLDEVQGKHHRMFCDASYSQSGAYAEFWETLRGGKLHSGEFKRLHKSGAEVWIEASYNPVYNAKGELVKIVKFAIDVTARKTQSADWSGQLEAISKSQAVIEFRTDGTILTANDNFLGAMGYTLKEIVGKHHGIFVEANYRSSPEYKQFWAELAAGKFQAAEYMRISKSGVPVWIQATYNPILDAEGKPFKIVKYATDITGRKAAVETITQNLDQLAEGNLSARIDASIEQDFVPLRDAFNGTVSRLSDTISQIKDSTMSMVGESSNILRSSHELSAKAEEQAASLEETSAAMEEVSATVRGTAGNAADADNAASEASKCAQRGQDVVNEAVVAMDSIEESSKSISNIISVIEGISFQTNLLALNAAVEAARAGDAGKGFAVVASEVRTLAQRSSEAAKDITDLIQSSAEHVSHGAKLVRESGDVLSEINDMVVKVEKNIRDIASASNEQSGGVREITSALSDIDATTQKNADLSKRCAEAAENISGISTRVEDLVGFFQIEQMGHGSDTNADLTARVA